MRNDGIKTTDRENLLIAIVANMSDREAYGTECFLAGLRAGKNAPAADRRESATSPRTAECKA